MATRKRQVITHDPLLEVAEEVEPAPPEALESEPRVESLEVADASIDLGESLTIQEVGELMVPLRDALIGERRITLDAGGLGRVDGAGLQLLCLLFKEARDRRLELAWSAISEGLGAAARQLGLAEAIGLVVEE